MTEYKRVTDNELFEAIEKIKREDEGCLAHALEKLILVALDTRQFLRKMYKENLKKPQVYKRPTGQAKDIIVGK